MESDSSEKWKLPSGEIISVSNSSIPYVLVSKANQEIILCERCYKSNRLPTQNKKTIGEIHYQFGLEYKELERFSDSIDALYKALQFMVNADVLAAIAFSYGKLGDLKMEKEFYLQALAINPRHATALENLSAKPK